MGAAEGAGAVLGAAEGAGAKGRIQDGNMIGAAEKAAAEGRRLEQQQRASGGSTGGGRRRETSGGSRSGDGCGGRGERVGLTPSRRRDARQTKRTNPRSDSAARIPPPCSPRSRAAVVADAEPPPHRTPKRARIENMDAQELRAAAPRPPASCRRGRPVHMFPLTRGVLGAARPARRRRAAGCGARSAATQRGSRPPAGRGQRVAPRAETWAARRPFDLPRGRMAGNATDPAIEPGRHVSVTSAELEPRERKSTGPFLRVGPSRLVELHGHPRR
ncbi:hypothetical protein BS78_10G182600 [Paspalum vaginatum]|nr:hypothetical protein BS78_10G182600 [Paspalum vaginatum]